MPKEQPRYKVLRDTREKANSGWLWEPSKFSDGTERTALKTGDYTIEGFEDVLCIERKATVEELAMNLTEKRFFDELERMSKFKFKFLILEFTLTDVDLYPESCDLPQTVKNKIQMRGKFIIHKLTEIQLKYGVQVVFAGNRNNGWLYVSSIFKRLVEGVTPLEG